MPLIDLCRTILWRIWSHAPQNLVILWRILLYAPQNILHPMCFLWHTWAPQEILWRIRARGPQNYKFLWRTCPYAPQNLGHPMCWLWPTWDPPKSCGALAYMRHRKGIFCGAYVPMRHRISSFLWRMSLHAPQKKKLWRTRSICATE